MEVGASIAKTFKRFTIPRSTSSIGSFTTSNGTASSTEEVPTVSTSIHPPISYTQHYRSHNSQQNLNRTRPVSEDISSYMIRSASTDFPLSSTTAEYTTKKSKVIEQKIYFQ